MSLRGRPASFQSLIHVPELIMMIFDSIDDYGDLLSFGFTCSTVWACGLRKIKDAYDLRHAHWFEESLICLGNRAEDLPSRLNNTRDLSELTDVLDLAGYGLDWLDDWDWPWLDEHHLTDEESSLDESSLNVMDEVITKKKSVTDFTELETESARKEWKDWLETLLMFVFADARGVWEPYPLHQKWTEEMSRTPEAYQWWFGLQIHPHAMTLPVHNPQEPTAKPTPRSVSISDPDTKSAVMVLRNLTKRQYVRSDTLAVTGADPVWGFGRALVTRICWFKPTPSATSWEKDLGRGSWAGDCFVVEALVDWLGNKESPPGGWTDVTMEVRAELEGIWRSRFGDEDWVAEAW